MESAGLIIIIIVILSVVSLMDPKKKKERRKALRILNNIGKAMKWIISLGRKNKPGKKSSKTEKKSSANKKTWRRKQVKETAGVLAIRDVVSGIKAPTMSQLEKEKLSIVYIISAGDYYKVGTTTNLKNRLASFQTANGNTIYLLGALIAGKKVERQIHRVLEQYQTETKNEWFNMSPELTELINYASIKE